MECLTDPSDYKKYDKKLCDKNDDYQLLTSKCARYWVGLISTVGMCQANSSGMGQKGAAAI
ncbi:hypothetical protein GCM10007915_06970 [Psychrobacter pacificensis]|uniref:Uncharacterized protein n=1 Tax=Psychrobacter pacificensis TaxID=112002 RepID=A0ABQ5Z0K4_9GAMM|nr:hypothetical protein GCM10007915_06970 [Psychrobacter pacificensis]